MNTRMGNSDEWKEFGWEYRSDRRRKYKTLSPKASECFLNSIRLKNKKVENKTEHFSSARQIDKNATDKSEKLKND